MKTALAILMVEDSPQDAELILETLRYDGIDCRPQCVETERDFTAALKTKTFDLILSDCSLPSFDGLAALRIARSATPDTPFIFVSGTIGEEVAIETLKNGATDYILKHRLSRLGPAVRRAMAETQERLARRDAERLKLRAESLFSSLFNQMTVGIIISDLADNAVRANAAARMMFGYDEAAFSGLPLAQLIDYQGVADRQQLREQALLGETALGEHEGLYRRRDGVSLFCRTVISLMKDGDAPCFFVTLIQDITERKELERRFIEAQKMEVAGRLAAGIAHDFNNLLTVINGYSTLLLDKTAPEDTAHRELSQIRDAGERAATLTQRLLSFSRHEVVRPVILDLNIVISGMVHILRRLLGSSVALVTELEPVACPMEADQTEIEQVIMNLVINARDAMPAGGAVKITTRLASVKQEDAALLGLTAGKYVTLSVKDDGCGMDQGTMARIFEPFFTTKEVGKGTGLGLWMVRETAHQSRGSVAVESGLGKGTTFRMFFPRVQAPVSRASEPLVPSKVAPESKTVMVADDDAAIRMYVVDVLQAAGYIVLEAHNGRQAIETMSKRSIDLLITDLVMPDQDGLETINTTKIRFPNVKMIAMSGAFDGACLKAAFHMGADAKLHKPFGAATLREMVGRILGVPILKIASTTSPQ